MAAVDTHLPNIGINDEWETQNADLQDAMRKYKINPAIDVFASKQNHKFNTYFTKENSAFDYKLLSDCFANPMYSEIEKCMKFLYYQHLSHNVNMLILTYAKTDTAWWHSYVEDRAETHFVKSRMKFMIDGIIPRYCYKSCKKVFYENIDFCPDCSMFEPVRLKQNTAPYPNVWIIYRKKRILTNSD